MKKANLFLLCLMVMPLSSCDISLFGTTIREELIKEHDFDCLKFMRANLVKPVDKTKEVKLIKSGTYEPTYLIEGHQDCFIKLGHFNDGDRTEKYNYYNLLSGTYLFNEFNLDDDDFLKEIKIKSDSESKLLGYYSFMRILNVDEAYIRLDGKSFPFKANEYVDDLYINYETFKNGEDKFISEYVSYYSDLGSYKVNNIYKYGDPSFIRSYDHYVKINFKPTKIEEFNEFNDLNELGLRNYHFLYDEYKVSLYDDKNELVYTSFDAFKYLKRNEDGELVSKRINDSLFLEEDGRVLKFDFKTNKETKYEVKGKTNLREYTLKHYKNNKTLYIDDLGWYEARVFDEDFNVIYESITNYYFDEFYELNKKLYLAKHSLNVYKNTGSEEISVAAQCNYKETNVDVIDKRNEFIIVGNKKITFDLHKEKTYEKYKVDGERKEEGYLSKLEYPQDDQVDIVPNEYYDNYRNLMLRFYEVKPYKSSYPTKYVYYIYQII